MKITFKVLIRRDVTFNETDFDHKAAGVEPQSSVKWTSTQKLKSDQTMLNQKEKEKKSIATLNDEDVHQSDLESMSMLT